MTRRQDRKLRPVCESLEGRQVLSLSVPSLASAVPVIRGSSLNDAARDITVTRYDNLGANHHMNSVITLRPGGHIDATTETWTGTWFGGFTGGVKLIFFDAQNVAIGQSNVHTFGVDGTWLGRSYRVAVHGDFTM